jgi:hypothetical protein
MEPFRACLVTSSPPDPVQVMRLGVRTTGDEHEQPFDLRDRQRDQTRILRWLVIGLGRQYRAGVWVFAWAAVTAQTASAAIVNTT